MTVQGDGSRQSVDSTLAGSFIRSSPPALSRSSKSAICQTAISLCQQRGQTVSLCRHCASDETTNNDDEEAPPALRPAGPPCFQAAAWSSSLRASRFHTRACEPSACLVSAQLMGGNQRRPVQLDRQVSLARLAGLGPRRAELELAVFLRTARRGHDEIRAVSLLRRCGGEGDERRGLSIPRRRCCLRSRHRAV